MKPIEKYAADIYTRNIYLKFLQQLQFSDAYTVEEIEKDRNYNVVKLMKYPGQEFDRNTFVVEVQREQNLFDCICAKYQRDGILCCHVLRLLTQLEFIKFLKLILKKDGQICISKTQLRNRRW